MKWFTLVDDSRRECLALEVRRGMTAQAVVATLVEVVQACGVRSVLATCEDLTPRRYNWDAKLPEPPIAVPGKTKFV